MATLPIVWQHCFSLGNIASHLVTLYSFGQFFLSSAHVVWNLTILLFAWQYQPLSCIVILIVAAKPFGPGLLPQSAMPPSTSESDEAMTPARGRDKGKQKRNKASNESKHKAKKLRQSPPIEWGDYDPPVAMSGSEGESELHDFLRRLEQISTFAETRTDAAARFLAKLRKSTKLDILAQLQSTMPNFPQDDVILLTDAQSLDNALVQPFEIPLLHRTTTDHPSLGTHTNFGIAEFCNHLGDDVDASISGLRLFNRDCGSRERARPLFVSFWRAFRRERLANARSISSISRIVQRSSFVLPRLFSRMLRPSWRPGASMTKVRLGRHGRPSPGRSFSSYH